MLFCKRQRQQPKLGKLRPMRDGNTRGGMDNLMPCFEAVVFCNKAAKRFLQR